MNGKALTLMLALAVCPQVARADGCFLPTEVSWKAQRERALINEPEQKAVIYFHNGREQLIISPSYQGRASNFAWVIPVPTRPHVNILRGELFHELARIVEPRPRRDSVYAPSSKRSTSARPGVVVLERKTVGAYDVSVLSATDSGALRRWLDRNRYALPPRARQPLAAYVREGWTLVACRIKVPERAGGLKQGVLAPLSLTFKTPRPIYPMRLSAANPRSFNLLLYLILPEARGKVSTARPVSWPGAGPTRGNRGSLAPGNPVGRHPTLAKVYRGRMRLIWKKTTLRPQECTRDYVWNVRPGGR